MTEAQEFWNKSADNYDKTEERFDVIHRRSRELAKGHLNETDLVLDYGCGLAPERPPVNWRAR